MKIVIATPVLFNNSSPFNHLFRDILNGFLEDSHKILRLVACRDKNDTGYDLGINSQNIKYKQFIRAESSHNNIISRYLRDIFTTIRQAHWIRKSNADVLFEDVCYSSFISVGAAKRANMRAVCMVQDIWPDNAVQSGLIKSGGILYKFFEFLQRKVYRKADRIICISDDMKAFVEKKGVDEKKIEVIYNWGYSDNKNSIPTTDNEFIKKYSLDKNQFHAVYAGNVGKMQNVELIVKAASMLKDNENIEFLIIGDGSNVESVKKAAIGLNNIRFFPLQESYLAEHIYSMADVNIIPLVKSGYETAMPSKTAVVLSCGKPVIFCFGAYSKFGEIIKSYESISNVSSTDESDLAREIEKIYSKKTESNDAYSLFSALFSRNANIEKYKKAIL